jgi:hypothetical protein
VFSILFAGCRDATSAEDAGRRGRYIMRTINGKRVPGIVQENANKRMEFNGGALRLNIDGTFTDSTDLTITPMFLGSPMPGGEVQRYWDVAWGLYRISGDTVYFDSLRDEHYYMVFEVAGALKQNLAGSTLFYQK